MKSAAIAFGYGCSRARVDVAALFDYVEANGWKVADSIEGADLVIVSSCAFDQDSEDRSDQVLAAAHRRKRDDAELVVVGCAGHLMGERISELGARGIPPRRFAELDEVLGATVPLAEIPDPSRIEGRVAEAAAHFTQAERHADDGPAARALRALARSTRIRERLARRGVTAGDSYLAADEQVYTIRVARGCLGACAYCAIRPSKEAELVSKPLEQVLAEFDAGLAAGAREFKLVAQDLGAYGQDADTDVASLLEALLSRDGEYRITIPDLGGRWLVAHAARLLDTLAAHAERVRYLAVPIQSGSDRVLGRMRRGHSATEVEPVLRELKRRAPGIHLSTQVLVGFPGETEADFAETQALLRRVGFDRIDVYDFSARPGTAAVTMSDHVPDETVRDRSRRLRAEFDSRAAAFGYRARAWVRRSNRRRATATPGGVS